jgi:hypothetical protein
MGETGAMVVATAGKQGEQVTKVTDAVKQIDNIVTEMTKLPVGPPNTARKS